MVQARVEDGSLYKVLRDQRGCDSLVGGGADNTFLSYPIHINAAALIYAALSKNKVHLESGGKNATRDPLTMATMGLGADGGGDFILYILTRLGENCRMSGGY